MALLVFVTGGPNYFPDLEYEIKCFAHCPVGLTVAKVASQRDSSPGRSVNLRLHDKVSHQGVDFQVDGLIVYQMANQALRLACLRGGGETRFLGPPATEISNRILLLAAIEKPDLCAPFPQTIYHRGESYLLRISGEARVVVEGEAGGYESGMCHLWRYRAAGDLFLQIEEWPDGIRMLAGSSVDLGMLEVRPQKDR